MSRGDYYFAQGVVIGLGKLFFLKVLQEASDGSPPRRLLGSFVDEIDYGILSTRSAPGIEHSWDPEYFLKLAKRLPGWEERDLTLTTDLANFTSEYKVETKAGINAKAAFPGAPVSAGIEVDYSKLRTAKVTMGAGSRKIYIPDAFVPEAYRVFAEDPPKYDRILFDNDHMLVTQIVIVRNLSVEVESHSEFSVDFNLKATKVNDLGGGITYKRTGDRKFKISVEDGKDYLFGIKGVEADKFAD